MQEISDLPLMLDLDGTFPATDSLPESLLLFAVIDWPCVLGIRPTPLNAALETIFQDPIYSRMAPVF
jgi:hypothetical protein